MEKPQQICDAEDVKRLGTMLFVGAHPDDETFCCGGLLTTAVQNGQRVVCLTATRGERGVQDESRWPVERLGEIRAQELDAAMEVLGIREHHWLHYLDGECDRAPEDDAAQAIASLIERCNVQTVLTFGPDGLTGHPDHQSVSRWVDAAVHISSRKPRVYHVVQLRESYQKYLKPVDTELDIFFLARKPLLRDPEDCSICLRLSHRSEVAKYRALEVMPSQTADLLRVFPAEKFGKVFGTEALVDATDARRL